MDVTDVYSVAGDTRKGNDAEDVGCSRFYLAFCRGKIDVGVAVCSNNILIDIWRFATLNLFTSRQHQ